MIVNLILETLLISSITVIVLLLSCYLYALTLDWSFDIPTDDLSAEEEMHLMMDAKHGGLSRHWNWVE